MARSVTEAFARRSAACAWNCRIHRLALGLAAIAQHRREAAGRLALHDPPPDRPLVDELQPVADRPSHDGQRHLVVAQLVDQPVALALGTEGIGDEGRQRAGAEARVRDAVAQVVLVGEVGGREREPDQAEAHGLDRRRDVAWGGLVGQAADRRAALPALRGRERQQVDARAGGVRAGRERLAVREQVAELRAGDRARSSERHVDRRRELERLPGAREREARDDGHDGLGLRRRADRLAHVQAVRDALPRGPSEPRQARLQRLLLAPQVIARQQPTVEEVDRPQRVAGDDRAVERLRGHGVPFNGSMRTVNPLTTGPPLLSRTRTTRPSGGGWSGSVLS